MLIFGLKKSVLYLHYICIDVAIYRTNSTFESLLSKVQNLTLVEV